jgi:hypothetical protein
LSSYKERKKAHKLAALATQIQRPNQTRTHTSHSDAESIIDRESGEFCKNLSISEGIGGGAGLARFKSIKSSARSVMSILVPSTNKKKRQLPISRRLFRELLVIILVISTFFGPKKNKCWD